MCKLTSGFDPVDCTGLEQGGVSGDLYLINYEDYLTATVVQDADCTITDITLTTVGSQAYKYILTRGSFAPSTPLTVNDGGKSGFLHTLAGYIPTKDQSIKKQLSGLINFGRVVAIVVLDSGVVSNLYGNDMGLSMTSFDETPADPSLGGGLNVTFSTPANVTLENLPARTFFNTDRATTIAALEALLVPVP